MEWCVISRVEVITVTSSLAVHHHTNRKEDLSSATWVTNFEELNTILSQVVCGLVLNEAKFVKGVSISTATTLI